MIKPFTKSVQKRLNKEKDETNEYCLKYIESTLQNQKSLIENEIKKLSLDLDFLKIKQSNLKVYCLSKYRNEIDNNNEYKLSTKFALNNESKGTIKFNSGDFSI